MNCQGDSKSYFQIDTLSKHEKKKKLEMFHLQIEHCPFLKSDLSVSSLMYQRVHCIEVLGLRLIDCINRSF